MENITKKVILIVAIFILLFSINSKVYAWSDIIKDGNSFLEEGKKADEGSTIHLKEDTFAPALQDLSSYLYWILLSAGVVIAVIVATVLGIQAMIGGAEGQAKVKEMLIPFVVGCIVVFGGFGLWKIAVNVGTRIEQTTQTKTPGEEKSPEAKNPAGKSEYTTKQDGRKLAEQFFKENLKNNAAYPSDRSKIAPLMKEIMRVSKPNNNVFKEIELSGEVFNGYIERLNEYIDEFDD